jgi:hypothetical protein
MEQMAERYQVLILSRDDALGVANANIEIFDKS